MSKSGATLPAPDTEERPAEIGGHADVPDSISNQYDSFVNPMIGRVGAAFRELEDGDPVRRIVRGREKQLDGQIRSSELQECGPAPTAGCDAYVPSLAT